MTPRRNAARPFLIMFLAGVVLLTLAAGSVAALSARCDRQVGDETDFPLFVALGEAACGAAPSWAASRGGGGTAATLKHSVLLRDMGAQSWGRIVCGDH